MTTALTPARARTLGYDVTRGAYRGTTDDRLDRWYVDRVGSPARRHGGYTTRRAALEALAEWLRADADLGAHATAQRVAALRAAREATGQSQAVIASRAGVTTNTVARIERGEITPREPTLRALEAAVQS